MNPKDLTERLEGIKLNKYSIPSDISPYEFICGSLDTIGSTDAKLRDELYYEVLARWIAMNVFSKDELKQIKDILISENYLFYNIDINDETSVYKRTFSILLLAPIVYMHRENKVFTKEELYEIKNTIIKYISLESNLEGYHKAYGWAHAAAHTSDTVDELFQCEEFSENDLRELLYSLGGFIIKNSSVYTHAEDERMAYAVSSLSKRNDFSHQMLIDWIEDLFSKHQRDFSNIISVYRNINIRMFFKSLYFYVKKANKNALADLVEEKINKLMRIE